MRMESGYVLTASDADKLKLLESMWDDDCETMSLSLEGYCTDVFEVMEKVIKVVDRMEKSDANISFSIAGKCESDYDCVIFTIEYTGDKPMIKAAQADPEENEERYYTFMEANTADIFRLLKRNKNRTFKQAIKDELPLGGFLDIGYEEWVATILSEE